MGDLQKILSMLADGQQKVGRTVRDLDETDPLRQLELKDSTSVASASTITLGQGNYFDITGVTTINNITLTGWTSGAIITLRFAAALTITHEAGGDGQISLCAGADLTTAAGTILGLILDGTTWREIRLCTGGGAGVAVGARVYNSSNISLPDNTTTELTFDSERFDTNGFHSTVSSTGRLTAPFDGLYTISLSVSFASAVAGGRSIAIEYVPLARVIAGQTLATSGGQIVLTCTTLWYLSAGEQVRALAYQNSGGPINVQAADYYSPEFSIALNGA